MKRGPALPTAAAFLPPRPASLSTLASAARGCRGCPLYQRATQTVFGEGASHALVVLVGEQPGDEEDRHGRPFVGPAGRLLDRALHTAHLPRHSVYVTNAVKHFKFETPGGGKRRLHAKPTTSEVEACRPWLELELEQLRPYALVALGATAAQALFGRAVRTTRDRGRPLPSPRAPLCLVTYHPSAVLRARDADARAALFEALVDDLGLVARRLAEDSRQPSL
jgi:DNA polymerase